MARRIHQQDVDVQQENVVAPYAPPEEVMGFITSGSSCFGCLAASPTRHSFILSDGYGFSIWEIRFASVRSESSHASSTSFANMTSILSWYCPTMAFGTVVRMV